MSNPAVFPLSEVMINNYRIRIEDNLGEAVHVHIGDFRISLGVDEFIEIVEKFEKATDYLLGLNSLSLEMFDKRSFDWPWLSRYEEIERVEIDTIKLKNLLTKGESKISSQVQIIIPVSESRNYKALLHDFEELDRYNEFNDYGVSNRDRLIGVLSRIKEQGYPYDNKYIIVNQFNQIYDGDHRAACLLYLFGEDKEIPVMRIVFKKEKTIQEQKKDEDRIIQNIMQKKKEQHSPVRIWSEDLNYLDCDFETLLKRLLEQQIDFFVIDHKWSDQDRTIADKLIVIRENTMIDFCKKMKVSYYGKSYFRYYSFLYSMQRCVYLETTDYRVIVADRMCCKSKFENAIIPLDKELQRYIKSNFTNHVSDGLTNMMYIIVDSLLNGCGFGVHESYIRDNIAILSEEKLERMLEKVFFNYTFKLLKHLKDSEYKKAFDEYTSFTEY